MGTSLGTPKAGAQRGMVLLLALIVATAMVILATAMMRYAVGSAEVTNSSEYREEALNLAKAGMSLAFAELAADKDLDGDGAIGAIGSTSGGASVGTPKAWGSQRAFTVTIAPVTGQANTYSLTATGIVQKVLVGSATQVSRQIQVTVGWKPPSPSGYFPGGAFGKISLNIVGNSDTDSYDSRGLPTGKVDAQGNPIFAPATYATQASQPGYFTNPALGGMNGNVGSNGPISTSGASGHIYGNATPGPGSTFSGGKPVTGSTAPNSALVFLPDPTAMTTPPPSLGAPVAMPATLAGSANPASPTLYRLNGMSNSVNVTGYVTVYLAGSITMHGGDTINLATGAHLTILQEPGNSSYGVAISGSAGMTMADPYPVPDHFAFISASTGSLSFLGNSNWYGTIYAPNAAVDLGGNGVKYGAFIGGTLTLHGNPDYHWDKNAQSPLFVTNGVPTLLCWLERPAQF